jgi:hypothetical protein
VRFHVLTVVNIKMRVALDIASCSLVGVYRCFRDAYCLHHQGEIFQKANIFTLESSSRGTKVISAI